VAHASLVCVIVPAESTMHPDGIAWH